MNHPNPHLLRCAQFTLQYWADDFITELLMQQQEHADLLTLAEPTALPLADVLDSFKRQARRCCCFLLLYTWHTTG